MAVDTAAATSSQAGSFHVRVAPVSVVAKQRGLRLGRSCSVSSLVTFLQLSAKFPSTAANNLHKFVLQPNFHIYTNSKMYVHVSCVHVHEEYN